MKFAKIVGFVPVNAALTVLLSKLEFLHTEYYINFTITPSIYPEELTVTVNPPEDMRDAVTGILAQHTFDNQVF